MDWSLNWWCLLVSGARVTWLRASLAASTSKLHRHHLCRRQGASRRPKSGNFLGRAVHLAKKACAGDVTFLIRGVYRACTGKKCLLTAQSDRRASAGSKLSLVLVYMAAALSLLPLLKTRYNILKLCHLPTQTRLL